MKEDNQINKYIVVYKHRNLFMNEEGECVSYPILFKDEEYARLAIKKSNFLLRSEWDIALASITWKVLDNINME